MNRERTWLRPWMVGVAAILLLAGVAEAVGGIRAIYIRYTQSASAPGISATDRTWVSSANDHPYFTDTSNVDHDLLAGGGGGGTFATTYSSTPANNLITESTAGGTVGITGAASATAPNLTLTQGSAQTGPVLSVVDSSAVQQAEITAAGRFFGNRYMSLDGNTGIVTPDASSLTLESNGNAITVPAVTDTMCVLAATQMLSAKTLASPVLSGTVTSNQTEATGPAFILNTTNAYTAATNGMLEIESAGHQAFEFLAGGANMYLTVYNSSTGAALAGLLFRSSEVALNTSKSNTLTGGTNNNSYLGASPIYWQAAFVNWYGVEKGALLADTATLTPTNGLHHVTGGATSVTTIATTNVPANQVARLTLIADTNALTFTTGGNIAAGGTIAVNTGQTFLLDGSTWYPVQ